MAQTNDAWGAAPKDATEINAQFPDGTTARVRWNPKTDQWEVLRNSGKWVNMRYEHGTQGPAVWWA